MIRGRNVTLYQYRIIISLVVVLLVALHLLRDVILLVQSVPSFLQLFTLGVWFLLCLAAAVQFFLQHFVFFVGDASLLFLGGPIFLEELLDFVQKLVVIDIGKLRFHPALYNGFVILPRELLILLFQDTIVPLQKIFLNEDLLDLFPCYFDLPLQALVLFYQLLDLLLVDPVELRRLHLEDCLLQVAVLTLQLSYCVLQPLYVCRLGFVWTFGLVSLGVGEEDLFGSESKHFRFTISVFLASEESRGGGDLSEFLVVVQSFDFVHLTPIF